MIKKLVMLIVDDIEVNRAILRNIFEEEYEIVEAENGREAIRLMREKGNISIILLDIVMPVMDGIQFLQYKKNSVLYDKIPVIVNTEYDQEENEIKALELGASDFIVKPCRPILIKHRVKNVVEKAVLERMKVEETLQETLNELQYRAERDYLTGIYNRETFYTKTKIMLQNSKDDYVIILWNIERFKLINDLFGQEVGDELLKEFASSIEQSLEGQGTFARLESDHFVSCFPANSLDAEKLLKNIESKMSPYGKLYNVFVNFGVYHIQDRKLPVGLMCDRAKLALQTIKGNYLKHYAIYDETMRNRLLEEQELTDDIENALAEEQFLVYLQPIYSVSDKKPVSAEALIRWKHPKKGFISPGVFVPLFERNGLITKIDAFVLEETCKFLQELKEEEIKGVPISVNLSRVNFYNKALCRDIIDTVEKYDIEPDMIRFEITESIYTDNPRQLLKTMKTLQKKGFKILMDDFGSGYSSLNMLKDVPVDILKIDMKFIDDLENSNRAGNIVTSVIRMAKWLNMSVVAEGVETKSQLDFLRSVGCDNIQGYYFSKPLPLPNFKKLLKDKRALLLKESKKDILAMFDLDTVWESDKKNNLLFNEMIGGMGIYELIGNTLEIIRANTGYFEIMGDSLDTIQNFKNVLDRVHEDDKNKLLSSCRKSQKNGKVEAVAVRRFVRNKNFIWLDVKIRFLGKAGRRSLFYFAFSDITSQKEYEQNIYINQYNLMLQGVYEDIFEFNYSDNTAAIIKKSEDSLYPYDKTVLLTDSLHAYENTVHPNDREVYQRFLKENNLIRKFEDTGKKIERFELRVKKKDNIYHWLEAVVIHFEDQMGKRIYLVCTRDIDEQKNAEEKDLQHMLDSIPVGLAICELERPIHVKYLNERAFEMFGIEKALQSSLPDLEVRKYVFFDDEKYKEMMRNTKDGKLYTDTILYCQKEDKSDLWIRAFITILEEGKGRFVCYAVLADVSEQIKLGRNKDDKRNLQMWERKKQILIVDDLRLGRYELVRTLSERYEILEAENGRMALELIEAAKKPIDLVITDIIMPVMDGFEFLAEIHKNPKFMKIPVVVVTSMEDQENEMKAFSLGAIDVIHKPFDSYALRQRVDNLLRLAEMERIETENRMLQKHQEIEKQFEAILEGAAGGIYRVSFEKQNGCVNYYASRIIYANESFFTIREKKMEEESSFTRLGYIETAYIPEDVKKAKTLIQDSVENRKNHLKCELRALLSDGSMRYILCSSAITYTDEAVILDVMETDLTAQKLAEERLRENEIFFQILNNRILPNTNIGIWRYDILRKRMAEVPNYIKDIIGDRSKKEIIEILEKRDYIRSEGMMKIRKMFRSLEEGEPVVEETFLIKISKRQEKDQYMWQHVTYTTIFDEKGAPVSAIGVSEDITQQVENEFKYKKEKQYRELAWNESLAFAEINLSKNKVEQADTGELEAAAINRELSYTDLIEACAYFSVEMNDRERFMEKLSLNCLIDAFKNGINEVQFDYKALLSGKLSYTWVTSTTQMIRDVQTGDIYANWQVRNIDEKKRQNLELREHAQKDPLTKLYNRYEIERAVNLTSLEKKDGVEKSILIMIDLDNFKMINDTFGHEFGDEVLISVGRTLKNIFRTEDFIGRIGGDEFVVFIPRELPSVTLERILKRVCAKLLMKFEQGDKIVQISGSVGAAFCPRHGKDFKTLYANADKAQYQAKKSGKNKYVIYEQ